MAILKVARMGNPVLRLKARALSPEEIGSPEFRRLIEDMKETMTEYGGIGLAAPQVHQSVQVALVGFSGENPRYPEQGEFPLTVLINPVVSVLEDEAQGFWEGCLSVPDLRGLVYRPRKIQVDYLDLEGQPRTTVAEDFLATVFQHELDHLAGVLYVDRIKDTTKLSFIEEYQRYWAPREEDEIRELAD
jgi:peptide deformylase